MAIVICRNNPTYKHESMLQYESLQLSQESGWLGTGLTAVVSFSAGV